MFTLNDPNRQTPFVQVSIINGEASTAMAHGDVVEYDAAAMAATGTAMAVQLASDVNSGRLAGVIYDPEGYGIAAGARGSMIVFGIHPSVKCASATIGAAGVLLANHTDGTAIHMAEASQIAGNVLGISLEAKSATTTNRVAAFINIK